MVNECVAGRLVRMLMLSLLLSGGAVVAVADDADRVRQLRDNDSILPLAGILADVERLYPGALLDVELEEEQGQVIYEVEILGRDHVIRKIKVDAGNGRIIGEGQD